MKFKRYAFLSTRRSATLLRGGFSPRQGTIPLGSGARFVGPMSLHRNWCSDFLFWLGGDRIASALLRQELGPRVDGFLHFAAVDLANTAAESD
jgi:hypothetical protein